MITGYRARKSVAKAIERSRATLRIVVQGLAELKLQQTVVPRGFCDATRQTRGTRDFITMPPSLAAQMLGERKGTQQACVVQRNATELLDKRRH